jgi:hypothetical protein
MGTIKRTTEERCFLFGLYPGIISGTVWGNQSFERKLSFRENFSAEAEE